MADRFKKRKMHSFLSISAWRKFSAHRIFYVILAVMFGLGIVAYFGGAPSARDGQGGSQHSTSVIATVNGMPIQRGDYETQWEQMRKQMGAATTNAAAIQGMVLDKMVGDAIVAAEAKHRGIKVTDAEVDRVIQQFREEQGSKAKPLSDQDVLQLTGASSMDEVRERQRANMLPRIMAEVLSGSRKLTEADLAASFDEVKVRHILIGVSGAPRPALHALPDDQAKRRATELVTKLRAGADFASLANQFTDDPSNQPKRWDAAAKKEVSTGQAKGGDLGWYRRGGGFDPAFEAAAFALKPGQISDPVRSAFGYHVIKVEQARRVLPKDYATKKASLLESLRQQRSQMALQQFVTEARKTAKIVWKDPGMQWRYEYGHTVGMAMMGMGGMPASADMDRLLGLLRAARRRERSDSDAAMALGQLLYPKYMTLGVAASHNKNPKTEQERNALRAEIIEAYEDALNNHEDRETRFTLARLYQEGGQKDKALGEYQEILRLLRWDDSPDARFACERLVTAFKQLGDNAQSAQAAKQAADLAAKEKADAARKAADEAKAKAEEAARAKEAKEWEAKHQQQNSAKPGAGGAAAPQAGTKPTPAKAP